jgi:hypothetical protein
MPAVTREGACAAPEMGFERFRRGFGERVEQGRRSEREKIFATLC